MSRHTIHRQVKGVAETVCGHAGTIAFDRGQISILANDGRYYAVPAYTTDRVNCVNCLNLERAHGAVPLPPVETIPEQIIDPIVFCGTCVYRGAPRLPAACDRCHERIDAMWQKFWHGSKWARDASSERKKHQEERTDART